MVELARAHWVLAKHVLRYLRGTLEIGLWYREVDEMRLEGFTDENWARSSTDRKSTLGCTFSIGSTIVSWFN